MSIFPHAVLSFEELISGSGKLVYHRYSIVYTVNKDQIWILILYRQNLP
ncbi:MAG TPA: hypothetical protein VFX68_04060 [Sulfuricurvum sp.]|nr:hypothetical protein [Sulfuricurvum sp.]